MFRLLLNSACTASTFFLPLITSPVSGLGKKLRRTQVRQLTPTDQNDIPYHMTSCSAIEAGEHGLPGLLNCSLKSSSNFWNKEKLYCSYFFLYLRRELKPQNSPAMDSPSLALLLYLHWLSALLFWCAWKSFSMFLRPSMRSSSLCGRAVFWFLLFLLPYCDFMLICKIPTSPARTRCFYVMSFDF